MSSLSDMAARLELAICWSQLDQLLTSELRVWPTTSGRGVWCCQPVPAQRNVHRAILPAARNALVVAAEGRAGTFTPAHVQLAKSLVLTALAAYSPVVEA